jgi:G:T-mismatch repair DNA endonuclease (very short patch repair protein)
MVDEKVTHFEKQWYVPNVGTIVESDNVFHRDMAKLREFGLHIIFKWLCAPASQDIRAQAKAS